ncbi:MULTISPECIES: hemerythrin domain-containing protein [Acidianus]|uniref:hemerythrin domain-containing protein n=1 Tax=Acidianus TaxID=12914 RepID=UPI00064FAD2F|nr:MULTISPECIES: hemerythrin domain-containing protein [Acidianus]NON61253.1 hemerythrin [Acidianus sp. RZ1]
MYFVTKITQIVNDTTRLLLFEHAVLRIRLPLILKLKDEEKLNEFEKLHDFVVNSHAKVEDIVVFPLVEKKIVDPYSHDHLLIKKYGDGILKDRRMDWIERYIKTVLDHNKGEEEKVFPTLKQEISLEPSIRIIKEFGNEKYYYITGLEVP